MPLQELGLEMSLPVDGEKLPRFGEKLPAGGENLPGNGENWPGNFCPSAGNFSPSAGNYFTDQAEMAHEQTKPRCLRGEAAQDSRDEPACG